MAGGVGLTLLNSGTWESLAGVSILRGGNLFGDLLLTDEVVWRLWQCFGSGFCPLHV